MIKSQIMKNETVQPNTRELEKLKEILPQYFDKEGNFKLDSFKEMLKLNEINAEKEGYELKFLGKNYSKFQSGLETETVIVPDIEHNSKEENINSENMYIVGDNLDALRHLLKSYSNKIKCIYIDPPYNTGKDGFVYNDNFSFTSEVLSEKMGIDEEEAKRIIELKGKSSHSAWLTFMYSRLELAQNLLCNNGIIFISIDDNEQTNLKLICDDIFGEENFIANLVWSNKEGGGSSDSKHFRIKHEYILVYGKDKNSAFISGLDVEDKERYKLADEYVETRGKYQLIKLNSASIQYSQSLDYPILAPDGTEIYPGNEKKRACWRWGKEKFKWGLKEGFVEIKKDKKNNWAVYTKQYLNCDNEGNIKERILQPMAIIDKYSTTQSNKMLEKLLGKNIFNYSKPVDLLKLLLKISIAENDIVLDFFSGSASTAHAIMELNKEDNGSRKYIMVQLPEEIKEDKEAYQEGYRTIDEIGRERIRRAGEKIKEENPNIDYGFKLFRLKEVEQNIIDKIIEFDPEAPTLLVKDYVEAFKYENTSGKDTILTTWLNEDGYGLIVKSKKVKLINYEIDVCNNSAYIIEQGITSEDIMKLIEMIEDNKLSINRIVIYPYSIQFNIIHELKNNIKQLHVDVELIERY